MKAVQQQGLADTQETPEVGRRYLGKDGPTVTMPANHLTDRPASEAGTETRSASGGPAGHLTNGLLAVWVLLLRMPSFFSDHLGHDEGLYLTIAVRMFSGDWLYTDIWDNKPPGIYLVYMLAVKLFGRSEFAINLASLLAVWATSLILLRIGNRGVSATAAMIAAFVFPCFMLDMEALGANAENFYILFDTMSASLALAYMASTVTARATIQTAALFGLFQGIAFEIKFLTIFETAGMGLVLAAFVIVRRRSLSEIMAAAIAGSVAFALPTLAVLAAFAIGGHLNDAVFAMFVVPRLYVQSPFGLSHGWATLLLLIRRLSYFAPMFVAAALAGIFVGRVRAPRLERWAIYLIAAWLVGAILSASSTGLFSYHYFIAVTPAASLLGGLAAAKIIGRFGLRHLVAVAVATVCLAIIPLSAMGRKEIAAMSTPPVMTQAELAAQIMRYVPPGTRIFATDQSPIVYALSGTVPATRYPFPYHLFERPALYGVEPLAEIRRIFSTAPDLVLGSRKLLVDGQGPVGALLRSELQDYREVVTSARIRQADVMFLCRTATRSPGGRECAGTPRSNSPTQANDSQSAPADR